MKNKGEILADILIKFKDCTFFLHNTKDLNIAKKILQEGYIFENKLPRSTDRVNPDEPVEINYFLLKRKDYGSYTIIIAIPNSTYELYATISNNNEVSIEEIMTITVPYSSDNDELIYTLSPKHVLGYFDIKNSEFFMNEQWDPEFSNIRDFPPANNKPGTGRK
jgi:hypothetical protein